MTSNEFPSVVQQLGRLSLREPPITVRKHQGMVGCTARADQVEQIASQPTVFWVDVEQEAPLEALLDRERRDG